MVCTACCHTALVFAIMGSEADLSTKMQISAAVKLTSAAKEKKKEEKKDRGKKSGLQKKEALVLALQNPTKHSDCIHMRLSPVLVALIRILPGRH